jgi:SPP1 gp7 family putative phage head morphogenesis protein
MTLAPMVAKGLKIPYPVFLEEAYKKQLLHFVAQLERLTTDFLTKSQFQLSYHDAIRNDDIVDDLERYVQAINAAISIETAKIIPTLTQHFKAVKQFTQRSFANSLSALGARPSTELIDLRVAIPTIDIELLKKMWIRKNTQLITSISEESLAKVRDLVYEAIRSGESLPSLALKLNKIFELTKKRAKIIARDQIGKLKSDLSRHNDLTHGFTLYEWSTCKDDAVRSSHRVLQGKICSWSDPTIYKNKITDKWKKRKSIGGTLQHVGADILCRCTNFMLRERSENAG